MTDDLELKRRLDALPREIVPPEDLWPGVRARIRTGGRADGRTGRLLRLAALLTILCLSAGALLVSRRNASRWEIAGTSRVLRPGDSLAGEARLSIGRIGTVEVERGSAVRLIAAGVSQQRMGLSRGTIHAQISAPPRLFVVETPSGTAVDLGCAYTLAVDSAGASSIVVTAGWVEFRSRGVTSLIPAGMRAATVAGRIGTPVRDSASAALAAAARAFDAEPSDISLGAVLAVAGRLDAVTLWHLVERTSGAPRERVVAALTGLVPLPGGVTREDILRAEPHAMQLYWTALPGTLPIIPSWQQALWRLWLKVSG